MSLLPCEGADGDPEDGRGCCVVQAVGLVLDL